MRTFLLSLFVAVLVSCSTSTPKVSSDLTPEELLSGTKAPNLIGLADCGVIDDVYALSELYFTAETKLVQRVNIVYFSNDTVDLQLDRALWVERLKMANEFLNANELPVSLSLQPSVTYVIGEPWSDPRTHDKILEQEKFSGVQRQDLRSYYLMDHDAFWHKVYGLENALNVYVYNDKETSFPGRAGNIPSNYFSIRLDYIDPYFKTFEHEVGHCWGLYHTHQSDVSGKKNSVDSGDRVCDTPYSPSIAGRVKDDCAFVARSKEAQGMPSDLTDSDLEVLAKNIMSYTNKICREEITKGQNKRVMKNFEMNPNSRATLVGFGTSRVSDIAPVIDISKIKK